MNVTPQIDVVELPLTQGRVALIDASDYEWAMQWSWRYHADGPRRSDGRGSTIQLHRALLRAEPGQNVKFKNGDKLDCRRCNLQLANRSGMHGVYWDSNASKWSARLRSCGQYHYIGLFDDPFQAKAVHDHMYRKLKEERPRRTVRSRNRSGIRGVSYDKKNRKWEVRITVNGKQRYVGRFRHPLEAAAAYDAAAIKYHGDNARLNNLDHLRDDQLKRLEDAKK